MIRTWKNLSGSCGKKHGMAKRCRKLKSFASLFMAFSLLFSSFAPAFAFEKTLHCNLEEHTHTDACYQYVLDCPVTGEKGAVISAEEYRALQGADSEGLPVQETGGSSAVSVTESIGTEDNGPATASDYSDGQVYYYDRAFAGPGDALADNTEEVLAADDTEEVQESEPDIIIAEISSVDNEEPEDASAMIDGIDSEDDKQPENEPEVIIAEISSENDDTEENALSETESVVIVTETGDSGEGPGAPAEETEDDAEGENDPDDLLVSAEDGTKAAAADAEAESGSTDAAGNEGSMEQAAEASAPAAEPAVHIHTAACYRQELVCGLTEHKHSLSCYEEQDAEAEEEVLLEELFPTFEDTKALDSYEYAARLAEFQKGYRESDSNRIFEVAEDGEEIPHGYTRYGEWAGDAYIPEWSALFAAFTAEFAGLDIGSFDQESFMSAYDWMQSLRGQTDEEGSVLLHDVEEYIGLNYADYLEEDEAGREVLSAAYYEEGHPAAPAAGELVFLDLDGGDFDADHVGIITKADLKAGSMTVMVGDLDDCVKEEKYDFDSMAVLGIARLPETEEAIRRNIEVNGEPEVKEPEADAEEIEETVPEEGPFFSGYLSFHAEEAAADGEASDAFNYDITVRIGEDARLPEGVELEVVRISEDDPAYETYRLKAADADGRGEEEVRFAEFFDITLKKDGVELEPQAPIGISIRYHDDVVPDGGVRKAVHFADNGEVEVISVADDETSISDFDDIVYENEMTAPESSDAKQEFEETAEEPAEQSKGITAETAESEVSLELNNNEINLAAAYEAEAPVLLGMRKLAVRTAGLLDKKTAELEGKGGMADTASDEAVNAVAARKLSAPRNAAARSSVSGADCNTFSFVQGSLSVTGTVVYKELTISYITAGGETYNIAVVYTDKANIPDDAKLEVSEILPGDEAYADYYRKAMAEAKAKNKGQEESENGTFEAEAEDIPMDQYARFFDISIMADGEKIQPAEPVSVRINLADAPESVSAESLNVVHFDEAAGPQLISKTSAERDDEGTTRLIFTAEGFSVWAVITEPNPTSTNDFDGRSFIISRDGQRYVTANVDFSSGAPFRLGKSTNISDAAVWTFEKNGSGYGYTFYHISTLVDGVKKYMYMCPWENNWGPSGDAHITLEDGAGWYKDNPQDFAMEDNGDGTYSIFKAFTQFGFKRYYLNETGGYWGNGFAGWQDNDGGSKLTISLVTNQPNLVNGGDYAVIIKDKTNNKYYAVQHEGDLVEVEYNERENVAGVTLDYPFVWTYTSAQDGLDGNGTGYKEEDSHPDYEPFNLRIPYEARAYNPETQLAEGFYYKYINPRTSTGLYSESQPNDHWHKWECGIRYENHTIYGIGWNGQTQESTGDYLGADFETKKIFGTREADKAATVFLAKIENVPTWNSNHETVSHIDIAMEGTAAMTYPLPYGIYYDENGNEVLTVKEDNKITLQLEEEVPVSVEDLKETGTVKAFDKDNKELDDAFYIKGYSTNEQNDHSHNQKQVRLEGSFKVTTLPEYTGSGRSNDNPDRKAKRLENQVYYEVSTTKSVTFTLKYKATSNDDDSSSDDGSSTAITLCDISGKPLTITAPVTLTDRFSYWDPKNECPPLQKDFEEKYSAWYYWNGEITRARSLDDIKSRNYNNWQEGAIIDNDWTFTEDLPSYIGDTGMDFRLGGVEGKLAVEIVKVIEDENGNHIHPNQDITNSFNIWYNEEGNPVDVEKTGVPEPIKSEDIGYVGYSEHSSMDITVGEDGFGVYYKYDMTPGMYYVGEVSDPMTERKANWAITDKDGTEWTYKNTRVETEYVWRDNEYTNKKHVAEGYSGVPEVLGDYVVDDTSERNGFLEFYVYNVYRRPYPVSIKKVDAEDDTKALKGAEFDLYGPYDGDRTTDDEDETTGRKLTLVNEETLTTSEDGTVKLGDLFSGTYYLYETKAPEGYFKNPSPVKIVVKAASDKEGGAEVTYTSDEEEPETAKLNAEDGSYELQIKNTPLTEISVTKVWDDDEDRDRKRPDSITVTLLADGERAVLPTEEEEVSDAAAGTTAETADRTASATADGETAGTKEDPAVVSLGPDNKWTYTWTGLPKLKAGKLIEYTVEEDPVDEYSTEITGNMTDGFTVTNKYTPGITSVKATKVWDDKDDKDKLRPASVTVQLYADGTVYEGVGGEGTVVLSAANKWTYTWKDIPKMAGGKEIEYTVKETAVPDGYEALIEGDAKKGYTITNSHTPEEGGGGSRGGGGSGGGGATHRPGFPTGEAPNSEASEPDAGVLGALRDPIGAIQEVLGASRLPQTGQLWWPIPVLLIAGILLIGGGCISRRKKKD